MTEAHIIIHELRPAPHAHLVDKLGPLAFTSKGWGDGLGWSHDVSRTPASLTFLAHPWQEVFDAAEVDARCHKADLRTNDQGPLATTFRLIPRVLRSLSPINIAKSIIPSQRREGSLKISRSRRQKVERLLSLIDQAERDGCTDASVVLARLRMVRSEIELTAFLSSAVLTATPEALVILVIGLTGQFPPKGLKQDLPAAFAAFEVCINTATAH